MESKKSPIAESPMELTKYMNRMNPPLSQDTAKGIIEMLLGVSEEERDRRARVLLKVLQEYQTEDEIIRELWPDGKRKSDTIVYELARERVFPQPSAKDLSEMLQELIQSRKSPMQQALIKELRFLEVSNESLEIILWYADSDELAGEYLEWLSENKYHTTEVRMADEAYRLMKKEDREWRFCVVGNIVKTHFDEDGIIRYGTKAFTGGTKVYIPWKGWDDIDNRDGILVIGMNRFHRYVIEYVPFECLENIRFQILFKVTVLDIIDYEEAVEGDYCWGRTSADKKGAKAFAEKLSGLVDDIKKELVIQNEERE